MSVRVLRGGLAAVLLAALLMPLWAASQVVLTAYAAQPARSSVIVVMGETASAASPSPVYRARLERAVQLWRDGVAPVIATIGARPRGAATSEAAVGRSWLVGHGVPASAIVVVPRGSDSVASLSAMARLMRDLRWGSATLVSDPAQLARVRTIAAAVGIDADVASSRDGPGSGLTAEYVASETAALLQFQLISRWSVPPADGPAEGPAVGPAVGPAADRSDGPAADRSDGPADGRSDGPAGEAVAAG